MTILSGPEAARVMSESHLDPGVLIDRFEGVHAWASNFHRHPVVIDDVEYPSGEHAFNALKTADPAEREHVRSAPTPADAKRRGQKVTLRVPRRDWDARVRFDVMRQVEAAKFADSELRAKLLGTGVALLVEGNRHHDQHWGQCNCDEHRAWPGGNHLGRTLMGLRSLLAGAPVDRWPRVMVTGHRPQHFTADQSVWAQAELDRLAEKVRDHHGAQVAISGAAYGADTWWARSALRAGLRLWAYVPFLDQRAQWREQDRRTWGRLLSAAERTLVLGTAYDVRLLHSRNEFMLRDADLVIAVHDPAKTTGGTASTVRKARASGKILVLVDVAARRTRIERP